MAKCGKNVDQNNSNYGHFLRSVCLYKKQKSASKDVVVIFPYCDVSLNKESLVNFT